MKQNTYFMSALILAVKHPETFYRTPQEYWLLSGKAKMFGQA